MRECARWAWSEVKSTAGSVKQTSKETFNGAVSALAEDNGLSPLNADQNSAGRAIGHGLALVQSGSEIGGGLSLIGGGGGEAVATAPACATGVGCVAPAVGVGAVVGRVALTAHGTLVGANTLNNIFNKNTGGQQSSGQSGGQTSAGRPTDQNGRPLGPSGKPMIHQVNKATEKGAKDAARNAGQGAPIKHPSPQRGQRHYHALDELGLDLIEIDEAEVLPLTLWKAHISNEVLTMAKTVRNLDSVAFGTFYVFDESRDE